MTKTKPKTPNYAFIDGQNIETGLRMQCLELDFQALFDYLTLKYKVKKVYYCAKFSRHSSRQRFFKKLESIGFEMVFSSGIGNGKSDGSHKVNVDADLIVQSMKDYFMVEKFGLILLSGDGDFIPLIRFFEEQKQFVKIITATKISTSNMFAFDRYKKKQRFLTFIYEDLQKLTKKISPQKRSGGIDGSKPNCALSS
jgi:uncharacterized LabA/DUF88 family protein